MKLAFVFRARTSSDDKYRLPRFATVLRHQRCSMISIFILNLAVEMISTKFQGIQYNTRLSLIHFFHSQKLNEIIIIYGSTRRFLLLHSRRPFLVFWSNNQNASHPFCNKQINFFLLHSFRVERVASNCKSSNKCIHLVFIQCQIISLYIRSIQFLHFAHTPHTTQIGFLLCFMPSFWFSFRLICLFLFV